MANTAPKIAGLERIENPDVIDRKAETLVGHIRKAKHIIAFTGAGVSTSAGIPDFRGPDGAWTLRAQGRERTGKTTNTLQAIPTHTHMALVELQNQGILKYLVSQNCDGLHRRSGILPDRISELHGNSNLEYCRDCGKEYLRDFRAVSTYEKSIRDHRTGRRCASCHGVLLDTIINFGETLSAATFLRIELEFMGHYGEPSLEIAHEYNGVQDGDTQYGLEYDPESGQWATSVLMRGV
ncbi:NAD-dependent protein deacetylase SRT1 like [Verticillium longisporum]|nr:NAD-dependent protein deacetylase SRT1 like [Verticillium longisporum]